MNLFIYLLFLTTTIDVNSQSYHGSLNYKNSYGLVKKNTHGGSMDYGKSINYGSGAKVYGSVTKDNHSSGKYKHSAFSHGSGRANKYGSSAQGKQYSGKTYGSGAQGKQYSGKTYGSGAQGKQYSGKTYGSGARSYSTKTYGSGAQGKQYSGKTYGSGAQGKHYSLPFVNAFSPTLMPTESLPEVFHPPNPTYYPTAFIRIPITFNPEYTIPSLPLSFQIRQGATGWSSYPDSPPNSMQNCKNILTVAVSKITELDESRITNMQVAHSNLRRLSNSLIKIVFSYNITTLPVKIVNDLPNTMYYNITNLLKNAINDNTFNRYLHTLGLDMNITSIQISNYSVVYPIENAIESDGASNNTGSTISTQIYIGIGCISIIGILSTAGYFIYKKRKIMSKTSEQEIPQIKRNYIDVIPNPLLNKRLTVTNT
jgi:hypothetical protein